MDRFKIKDMRDNVESRGYLVEYVLDKCIVVSDLKDDDRKLLYVYPDVYDENGDYKVFDLNIRKA